ncbi:FecR family protein [Dyella sp. OK004]|uniref:FecR family protein n=1 Tax=Dyella sp. OK004 TaxID=1855292 RepID=UPI0008EB49F2|nr:FecR domain-containing protein [Dyella sp. OK004]SFS13470.1 FecR family protein [Dyella sp. OK004]
MSMQTLDAITGHGSALHREARDWLLRLTSGRATPADAQAFRHWCSQSAAHARAFAETRLLWDNLGTAARAISQREQVKTDALQRDPRRMSRRAFLGGAVAASAAFLLLRPPMRLWPDVGDMMADFRTATGEQRQVQVTPGVVVEMNTQTAINVKYAEGRPVGIELLTGEIQLQTLDGASEPFTIYASKGRVNALSGSQCNVRCLDDNVEVTGLNGTVRLEYQGRTESISTAQRALYGQRGMAAPAPADIDTAMAWRRRVLVFDNQPLSSVVVEINRYRPGKLILTNDALGARKVHARFTLNQLADAATLIHDAFGAHVTTLPGGIVLLS